MTEKKVRLVFTSQRGWKAPLAYLIRYLGNFEFSHVGVLDDCDIIYEATFYHGVRMLHLIELEKTGCPYIICDVNGADYNKAMTKARELNGCKYDNTVVFWHFISSLPLLKWVFRKPVILPDVYDCAAHTTTVLYAGGITMFKEHFFRLAEVRDVYLDPCVVVVGGNKKGLEIDSQYSDVSFNVTN